MPISPDQTGEPEPEQTSEDGYTLATPANMRAYEIANPSRTVETPDGEATIMRTPAIALDPSTGEEYAASSGDYSLTLRDDEPLMGEDGPCILVVPFSGYRDALTGDVI